MLIIKLVVYISFPIFLFTNISPVFAHPGNTASDGCHYCRTNCDYWGVAWDERHCHGGYQTYYKPTCLKPSLDDTQGSPTFSRNNCNQDVTYTWDKGSLDEFYSISISKYAGADPGPASDTNSRQWKFPNIKPGKWYVNIKPGNSCGWGDIYYWQVDVPNPPPIVSIHEAYASNTTSTLSYTVECANKITTNLPTKITKNGTGQFTVENIEDEQSFQITAINSTGESASDYIVLKSSNDDPFAYRYDDVSNKTIEKDPPSDQKAQDIFALPIQISITSIALAIITFIWKQRSVNK